MGVALLYLSVMKYTPNQDPAHQLDPASMHSLGYTLVASALMFLAVVTLVLALSYPAVTLGVAALATAGWLTTRTFRRFYRTRRRMGQTRQVCVPKIGVCLEI